MRNRKRDLSAAGDGADPHTLWQAIRADIEAVRRHRDGRLLPFLFPNLFAVVAFRVAHALGGSGLKVVAHGLCLVITVLTGLEISWRAEIGPGLFVHHTVGVVLPAEMRAGRNLSVGAGVLVGDGIPSRPGYPIIGDDVAIMAKASVIGPVQIGSGAIVAAHALVIRDVPAGATAIGVPAKNHLDGEIV